MVVISGRFNAFGEIMFPDNVRPKINHILVVEGEIDPFCHSLALCSSSITVWKIDLSPVALVDPWSTLHCEFTNAHGRGNGLGVSSVSGTGAQLPGRFVSIP